MEENTIESNPGQSEISPFEIIEDRDPPWVGSPLLIGVFGVLACAAVCGSLGYFFGADRPLKLFALVVIVTVFLTFTVIGAKRQRRRFNALMELLTSLNSDIENLQTAVDKYLVKLDRRADRYFNSMTPAESSLRYQLAQISSAILHRVEKVNKILSQKDREHAAIAYRYLQVPLKIKDGVIEKQAKQTLIPLKKLRDVCSEYIAQIEAAVQRIERERSDKGYEIISFDDFPDDL